MSVPSKNNEPVPKEDTCMSISSSRSFPLNFREYIMSDSNIRCIKVFSFSHEIVIVVKGRICILDDKWILHLNWGRRLKLNSSSFFILILFMSAYRNPLLFLCSRSEIRICLSLLRCWVFLLLSCLRSIHLWLKPWCLVPCPIWRYLKVAGLCSWSLQFRVSSSCPDWKSFTSWRVFMRYERIFLFNWWAHLLKQNYPILIFNVIDYHII